MMQLQQLMGTGTHQFRTSEMKFSQSIAQFLDHLRIERGLSQNTISAYQFDLSTFAEFVAKDVELVSEEDVNRYLAHLKGLGFKASSINRSLSSLRSFFTYLQRELEIDNPVASISTTKVPKRLPKALTLDEVTRLIESSWNEFDVTTLRDRALIELLYGTGARVSEVVGINLGDISTIESDGETVSVIKLRGKGSKERLVPIGSFAQKALDDYQIRLRPQFAKTAKSSALFLNQRGGRLSRVSAWNIVSSAAEKAGITTLVSPHVFRHSYATHLLDGGADIRVVQELLGHSSVTTTQIYTLITIDKVRESYITAHPRSK